MGHLYSLHVPLKNHTHNTCFSVSNFYTFQNNHPATACWILIIAIHPLLASLGVARAPYRAPAGQITCFSTILVIDPPRGLPAGGGGTARSWGCGGDSPHDIPATQSGNPPGTQPFRKKTRPPFQKNRSPPSPHVLLRKKIDRTDRFQNRSGRPLLFQSRNMRFHWMFRRGGVIGPIVSEISRTYRSYSRIKGSPLPPTCCSAKK